MKVFISHDIEGVSGVADGRDIEPSSPILPSIMDIATREVNAAVEGAAAAGATDICVLDGHGFFRRTLLYEQLDRRARLFRQHVGTQRLSLATER